MKFKVGEDTRQVLTRTTGVERVLYLRGFILFGCKQKCIYLHYSKNSMGAQSIPYEMIIMFCPQPKAGDFLVKPRYKNFCSQNEVVFRFPWKHSFRSKATP